jgi:hypothetical protein
MVKLIDVSVLQQLTGARHEHPGPYVKDGFEPDRERSSIFDE